MVCKKMPNNLIEVGISVMCISGWMAVLFKLTWLPLLGPSLISDVSCSLTSYTVLIKRTTFIGLRDEHQEQIPPS
jgi:hypothetical protein